MRVVFSVACLFIVAFRADGQADYLVTTKNDTIAGDLKLMSYDMMDRVQVSSGRDKEVYPAVKIRNVHYKGDVFAPVAYENSIRLMKLLKPGYLSIYRFRLPNQASYDGLMLKKISGESMEVPNLAFKKVLSKFLEDCEDVSSRVESGELRRGDIEAIVAAYNTCLESKTNVRTTPDLPGANRTMDAIGKLRAKADTSKLESRQDILDLLDDLSGKLKRGESIPRYLTEQLKAQLGSRPGFSENLEELLSLLRN